MLSIGMSVVLTAATIGKHIGLGIDPVLLSQQKDAATGGGLLT
jgi:hypothetical protein